MEPATVRPTHAALGGEALERVKVLRLDARTVVGGLPGTGSSCRENGGARFAETTSNPPLVASDGFDGSVAWNGDASGLVLVEGGQAGRAQGIDQAFAAGYALWGRGRGGLFLIAQGGRYVAIDARPGTPAARAGIVKGDALVTIDGKPAASMSLQAVRSLFLGTPGTVLRLGLAAADGSKCDVTLT